MADTFTLAGSLTSVPAVGVPSGSPGTTIPLNEVVSLATSASIQITLNSDSPVSVPFPGMTAANIISVKVNGSKVRVRLTSTDGSTQAVPVDGYFFLESLSVGITALDLTRTSGLVSIVEIFLGQQ